MKVLLKTFLLIFLFACSFLKSQAKGRDVVIFLKDSTVVKGELLSVRDSLVAIYMKPLYSDMDIYYEYVRIEKFSNIVNIIAPGNNAITKGLMLGGASVIGGIAYLWYGPRVYDVESEKNSIMPWGRPASSLGYVLMSVGPIVSVVAGIKMNKPELTFGINMQSYEISVKQDTVRMLQWNEGIMELKKNARFDGDEPRHVREIIDALLKPQK